MATAFPSFTSTIRATSAANNRRSVPDGAPKPTSANWWTPLFGWSSEADYINAPPPTAAADAAALRSETEAAGSRSGRPFTVGCFTEEKAKELRKKTVECSTFHDKMYHSAIASRLASDLGDR